MRTIATCLLAAALVVCATLEVAADYVSSPAGARMFVGSDRSVPGAPASTDSSYSVMQINPYRWAVTFDFAACCEACCDTPDKNGDICTLVSYDYVVTTYQGQQATVEGCAGQCCEPGCPVCCEDSYGTQVTDSPPTGVTLGPVNIGCGCCVCATGEERGDVMSSWHMIRNNEFPEFGDEIELEEAQ